MHRENQTEERQERRSQRKKSFDVLGSKIKLARGEVVLQYSSSNMPFYIRSRLLS